MKKVLVLGAVLLGLGFSLAQSVKVGVILPLTSVAGKAALNGIQLAADELAAAGKVKLELVVVDDGNAADKAIPALVKLLTVDRVDIVIGGLGSGPTLGMAGPIKQYKPLFLAVGAASSLVENAMEGYEDFFHFHPWDYHNVTAAMDFFKYLQGQGAKKVAILYEDGPFGSAGMPAYRQLLTQAGFTVQAEPFKTNSGNFTATLTRFKSFAPDILYWIGYDWDALPIATQVRQVGLDPKIIYGAPPAWPLGFDKNNLSNDIAGMSAWLPSVGNRASQRFVAAYKKKFGEITEEYMAPMGYTAVRALGAAIEAAGSADKGRISDALAKVRLDTPFGSLAFKPSDTGKTKNQGFNASIWFQFQYLNGSRRPVFPAGVAGRPLRYPGNY
ncbi:MAG: ABC transporter substrate-binding protein [Meiothermus sp.]|nr:ABC transporter substrate-binding protein [Meiothermus sp.]